MNYDIPAPVCLKFKINLYFQIKKTFLFKKGPGAYEVRDFKDPEKKYMSSAAFVSTTGRFLTSQYNQNTNPGPANYKPSKPTKQSFHYNSIKKWV